MKNGISRKSQEQIYLVKS